MTFEEMNLRRREAGMEPIKRAWKTIKIDTPPVSTIPSEGIVPPLYLKENHRKDTENDPPVLEA